MRPFFEIVRATNWSELATLETRLRRRRNQWVFRGHTDYKWLLETSLERELKGVVRERQSMPSLEGGLLRRFKRQAGHHLLDQPNDDNWVEWLALMQHHGAPTRLLDFTYSFFVGLYFAVEQGRGPYALWALDSEYLRSCSENALGRGKWDQIVRDPNLGQGATFAAVFAGRRGDRKRFVLPTNGYRLNPRLAIQQGVFLIPGDVTETFESNLREMLPGHVGHGRIVKCVITLNSENRRDVVQRLYRMNVTSATLFPGLDGFARSLRWALLAFPKMLRPDVEWPSIR